MTNQTDNQISKNIIYVLLSILLGCLFLGAVWAYMRPQKFMTDTGKKLIGKELVEAENAVRGNAISVGGAIFIVGTLLVSFINIDIERTKIRQEKEKEWRTQVESFYGEWAGIFLSQTRIGIELARAKCNNRINNCTNEVNRLQKAFDDLDLQRRKLQFRILTLEKRENVMSGFKEISQYAFPHEPIVKLDYRSDKLLKSSPEQNDKLRIFWDDLADNDYGTTVDLFHRFTEKRLTAFCEWISNTNDSFQMPNFDDYIKYVTEKKPALADRKNSGD